MLALNLNLWADRGPVVPWRRNDSLQSSVKQALTTDTPEGDMPSMPIRKNKLRARYLCDYAKVKLDWTNNLADHLLFQTRDVVETGGTDKVLKIFKYPSFLEAALWESKMEEPSPISSERLPADEWETPRNEKASPESAEMSTAEGREGIESEKGPTNGRVSVSSQG